MFILFFYQGEKKCLIVFCGFCNYMNCLMYN